MAERDKPYFLIQTVERALMVLDRMIVEQKPMTVSELSRKLKLHKSVVHRLLATLVCYKYVERETDSERYRIGFRSYQLGAAYFHTTSLIEESRDLVEQLMQTTGGMAHLGILHEGKVLYLLTMEATSKSLYQHLGVQNFVHYSGLGKCLCAWRRDEEVLGILQQHGMPVRTNKTVTTPGAYLVELVKVREQGFAIDDEEGARGFRCFAAPIHDYSRQVVAAVSINNSTKNFTSGRMTELSGLIKEYGRRISQRLGYDS
ncbi:MAG: IclR family transcriptional regulator [Paenibacillaceae bacterium]|nr:IclR family transcriptional regulator [Paenibacillaceae bacterium]